MSPIEKFKEIMDSEYDDARERDGCSVFQGLQIMGKYLYDKDLIIGADHDIVYAVELQELIDAGIRVDDIVRLRNLGWHVSEWDTMAKYV